MGNVLDNISKERTRFTIFENDQVLTADQLNDLFNYLDIQSRLTRTQAIGVGIICGLEIGVLENRNIVLSKGSAITTDGDLLHIPHDVEFDQYDTFGDINAAYPHFRDGNGETTALIELKQSDNGDDIGRSDLSDLERTTDTVFTDYIGVLYLEDYTFDPDVCTGRDCDNKGTEALRELKVLLVHKDEIQRLLQTIPPANEEYFSTSPITMPRVKIQTAIDTYQELNDAFNNTFSIKEELKEKLTKAYQVCKTVVEDEFQDGDPTPFWATRIDEHFNQGRTIYAQYLHDFASDLCSVYNELREAIFSEPSLCCPEVDLFPKHVLLGTLKSANLRPSLPESPISPPDLRGVISSNLFSSRLLIDRLPLSRIRFDIGSFIKRFNPVHIDPVYRHRFYESPGLSRASEKIQETKFNFMRIDALIRNFKVPSAEELGNVGQSIKITPSRFADKPLGERSIPFYYGFNRENPVHLYWDFTSNVRKKESLIYGYSSHLYSQNPATLSPLQYSLFSFDFFRVEGHIGFSFKEVESRLNQLIVENNLPFNVMTVQVERNPITIPRKPWFFPELNIYEAVIRNTFLDHLNQIDLVHDGLKEQTNELPESNEINLSIENFKNAKEKVLLYEPITSQAGAFKVEEFNNDVKNVIQAATSVKVQTKQFDFSQTAIPHDFVINTNILNNANIIADLVLQKETKKKEDLMLGNFMKKNPGLEHAAGVLRGGTFVLVYTSNDEKVVADFMLPYYLADPDLVPEPPQIRPLPLPLPKIEIPKIFKKDPLFKVELDNRIKDYVKISEIDDKVNASVDVKMDAVQEILDLKLEVADEKINGLAPQFESLDERLKSNTELFKNVFTSGLKSTPIVDIGSSFNDEVLVAALGEFLEKQKALENIPLDAPNRMEKETELINAADKLTENLAKEGAIANENNILVKSVLADVHSATAVIQNEALKNRAGEIAKRADGINKTVNKLR